MVGGDSGVHISNRAVYDNFVLNFFCVLYYRG